MQENRSIGYTGGLVFLRNRYYDPNSGSFTQEDPIGLAGGINLYGYAGGDPVNFSDPFGLCADPMAYGLGGLKCFLQDVAGGARATLQAARDFMNRPIDATAYARAGAGILTTQAEYHSDGSAALRVGGAVSTQAIGAAVGVRINSAQAPADAVQVRLSAGKRIGPVSVTAVVTQAISPNGTRVTTSRGVEVGAGVRRIPGLQLGGSVGPARSAACIGTATACERE